MVVWAEVKRKGNKATDGWHDGKYLGLLGVKHAETLTITQKKGRDEI
jgi:hypothetical protein